MDERFIELCELCKKYKLNTFQMLYCMNELNLY